MFSRLDVRTHVKSLDLGGRGGRLIMDHVKIEMLGKGVTQRLCKMWQDLQSRRGDT